MLEMATVFSNVYAMGRGFQAVWAGRDRETLLMELDLQPNTGPAVPLALVLRAIPDLPLVQDLRFYGDLSDIEFRDFGSKVLQ